MESKVTLVLRIVLGFTLLVFGSNKFFNFLPPMEGMSEAAGNFMGALKNTGYMFYFIGTVEVLAGLLLLFNKWVPFALVILAPVSLNILLFHLNLDLGSIAPGALVFVLNFYLIWVYRTRLKYLF